MITLDTDIVSLLLRRPPTRLVDRLERTPLRDQSTTAVTIGELSFGCAKAKTPETYERALLLIGPRPVFSFDQPAAERYGPLRAELEAIGQRLDDPDLRIAAIALANDLTLITGNIRHFERVPGLRVEDWTR